MPRKALKPREKRGIPDPDFKYGSVLAARFIGRVLISWEKRSRRRRFFTAP
jgi:small subunit ribosomal protein S7